MKQHSLPDDSSISRPAQPSILVRTLLVLTLLAIGICLALPKCSGKYQAPEESAARGQMSIFETAIDKFEVDTGQFPSQKRGLTDLIQRPAGQPDWHGPYLNGKVPLDPWHHPYIYQYPGLHNTNSFDLSTALPSGQIIGNWTIP